MAPFIKVYEVVLTSTGFATVREKSGKTDFSRSEKSQGITKFYLKVSEKSAIWFGKEIPW